MPRTTVRPGFVIRDFLKSGIGSTTAMHKKYQGQVSDNAAEDEDVRQRGMCYASFIKRVHAARDLGLIVVDSTGPRSDNLLSIRSGEDDFIVVRNHLVFWALTPAGESEETAWNDLTKALINQRLPAPDPDPDDDEDDDDIDDFPIGQIPEELLPAAPAEPAAITAELAPGGLPKVPTISLPDRFTVNTRPRLDNHLLDLLRLVVAHDWPDDTEWPEMDEEVERLRGSAEEWSAFASERFDNNPDNEQLEARVEQLDFLVESFDQQDISDAIEKLGDIEAI